ncbi:MAG: hypothetical protein HYW26_03815 [Candidatus Aenigmarchaeota archaeon]|nr:hypothetical protein [Candidatus Aenigmarchaeota archaeon]
MAQKSQQSYGRLGYLILGILILFGGIAFGTYIINLVSPFSETVNFIIALITMVGIFDTFVKPFLRKKFQ